ncbi:MAG: LysE family translocator [Actinomycetota bacterium]
MPDIALFLLASALLTIAPGPDIVTVLTRGISQGRRAGLAAAAGFATGCLFHTALATLGVAALLRSTPLAFDLIRYAGAAYLAWIGIQALRHREGFALAGQAGLRGLWAIYRQSVVGNALNPKVTLFFVSFLPQFVIESAVTAQMALLGGLFMAQTLVIFSAVALASGWLGERLRDHPAIGPRLGIFAGLTFLALGARLAFWEGR